MFATELPIAALLPAIDSALLTGETLIIEAPPGAGKTTVVPLSLLNAPWLAGRRILMLQPRRLAVRNSARRMAALLGESVGHTVGYRMRLETRVSAATRIEVVTEGVLLRLLRDDPSLEAYGLLILDEIHERSLDSDLGLALVLNARETFGADMRLKLIAMSATLNTEALGTLLDAPVLRSEGRQFPVTVHYGLARTPRERLDDRLLPLIDRVLHAHPDSSVLVFLPGQGEIRRIAAALPGWPGVAICPLYGELDAGAQQAAIAPSPAGQRKLVLATNIAETSLTIEGVDVVIDSGLARSPRFDPNTGMSRLETVQISRAASEQRAGRAGRLRPGHCYRLWSASQQESLAPATEPEISSADLAPLALQLFAWGVDTPDALRWLTLPPAGAWQQALDLLTGLGALAPAEDSLRLTPHGVAMAELPVHPRLAHLLLCGRAVGALPTASLLAAVLSERDPLSRESPDMTLRLDYLTGALPCPGPLRGWQQRCVQLAGQLEKQTPAVAVLALQRPTATQMSGYLLACAYPERIARRRQSGGYQLANGRSAQFDMPDLLDKQKWLAVAEVGGIAGRRGDSIRSAAPLDPALFETLLAPQIRVTTRADWDPQSGRFIAEREARCGFLLLHSEKLTHVTAADRVTALIHLLRDEGWQRLPWQGAATAFLQRAQLMGELLEDWPAFSEAVLRETLPEWLGAYLEPVQRLSDLPRIQLLQALRARLSWAQLQQLDNWLPERCAVPSGSTHAIDYRERPPVLAVKLQEMFGCEHTPSVAQGRLPLKLHLLSPAGRPLQVTQDLGAFWRNAYAEVRKEMKGRYPKHPWPEDPLTALPTRHTKARS